MQVSEFFSAVRREIFDFPVFMGKDAPFSGIEKCVDKLLTQANLWRSAETSGATREREARPVAPGKEAAEP